MCMDTKVFLSNKYKVSYKENEAWRFSPVYIGLLADGTQNNIKLPQNIYKIYDGLGQGTKSIKTYFSSFEFIDAVFVSVELPEKTKSITVKPKKYSDIVRFTENKAVFYVKDTAYLSIEPDGDIFGSIHIFCNKKQKYVMRADNIIEFTDGIYTEINCEYIHRNSHGVPVIDSVPDNTIIYIGKDAVVNAAIELIGVKNVKILGTGMLSLIDRCNGAEEGFRAEKYWGAFRYWALPNIYIRSGCRNIEIDGVLLNCEFRGIVIRNSEKISLKNIKIFTSTENADGINCYNTCDLTVDNCYIQSADDCFCMYNSCDSIPTLFDGENDKIGAICKNVEVKNCVMSSNARPIVLGGHATGETEPRCVIEDICIHDCEIVNTPYRIFGNTREYSMYWSGFLRILSQSEQIVRKLVFKDIYINVTKGHNGKIFHLEVRDSNNASYTESKGFMIEDIQFINITVNGSTEALLPSLIRCRDAKNSNDNPSIKNILFENIKCRGRSFDKNSIVKEGPVSNIIFK